MVLLNLAVLALFFAKAINRYIHEGIKINDIKFILAILCAIIALSIMIFPRPTPMPIVVIGFITFIFALSLAYSITYSDLNRVSHHILQDKFTPITILFCIIISVLGYLNGDNLVYFIENESYRPTVTYYAYQYISFGFILWLVIRLTKVYLGKILKYKNTTIRIRHTFIFTGWCIAILCYTSVIINLILSHINIDTHPLNEFFNSAKGFAALFIAIGEITQKSYNKLLDNIAAKIDNLTEKLNKKIHELHEVVVAITPIVQLPDKSVKEIRIMAEIGHSLRVICTNIQHPERISPKLMAKYVFDNKNKTLGYGHYPPLQRITFPKLYYLLIYRHLQELDSISKKGTYPKWFNK